MNRRQKYFLKQRIMGILTLLLAVIITIIMDGDISVAIFLVPMGLSLLFSKKMIWEDDYKAEMEEIEWRKWNKQ